MTSYARTILHSTYTVLVYYTLLTSSGGTKCLYSTDNVNIFSVVLDLMASIRYCTPPSDILSHPYIFSLTNVGLPLITSARLLAPCSPNRLPQRSSVISLHLFSPPHSLHMASSSRRQPSNLNLDSVVLCLSAVAG